MSTVRKLGQLLCGASSPTAGRTATASPVDVLVDVPALQGDGSRGAKEVNVSKQICEAYVRLVCTAPLPWSFFDSGKRAPQTCVPAQHAAAGRYMSNPAWDGWNVAVGAALLAHRVIGEEATDSFYTRLVVTAALLLSMKFARHDWIGSVYIYRVVHFGSPVADWREGNDEALLDALIETQSTLVCRFNTFDAFARTPAQLVEDWCHRCVDDAAFVSQSTEVALICVRNAASFFAQIMVQGGADEVADRMYAERRDAFVTALAVASVVHVELVHRSGHVPHPVPGAVRERVQREYAAARIPAATLMDACIVFLADCVGARGACGDAACGKLADRRFLLCTRRVLQQERVLIVP